METIRAFIALEPDPQAAGWLAAGLDVLRREHPRVRWVRREHLHLTLKFLGDIPAGRVEEIRSACEREADLPSREDRGEGRPLDAPLRLEFGPPGHFGPRGAPRTLWVGYRPGPALEAVLGLQGRLEGALLGLGFPREARGWTPHITLGRNPRGARLEGWERLLPAWPGEGNRSMAVGGLHLYKSALTPQGPIHTLLWELALGAAGPPREAR